MCVCVVLGRVVFASGGGRVFGEEEEEVSKKHVSKKPLQKIRAKKHKKAHGIMSAPSSSCDQDDINVLVPLGPVSQSDVNENIVRYFSRHLASPRVRVRLLLLSRVSPKNQRGEERIDPITKRFGCRKAAISVLDDSRLKKKVVDVPGAALEKTFVPEFMPLGGKLRASLFSLSSGQNVKSIEVFEVDPESGFLTPQHPGDLRWNVREKALYPGKMEEETQPAFYVPNRITC